MRYPFSICDVFTNQRFGGNQLAVLPEAAGLSDGQMQQIAREFNFAETTFVFPPERGHTRRVRIFTPVREVPFAGHPNVGTAFVLATRGALGPMVSGTIVTFEEGAGLVPISIDDRDGRLYCELSAPARLTVGPSFEPHLLAAALSLDAGEILTSTHPPQVASVGLPFIVAELSGRDALSRARVRLDGFEALAAHGVMPDVHLYFRSHDEFDLRARMFAPLDGVPEDPATGSANCALAGLLAQCDRAVEGQFAWRVAQGVEMRRPSVLHIAADKQDGVVTATRVGGGCVLVAEGTIETADLHSPDRAATGRGSE